jgi:hypothetical protein
MTTFSCAAKLTMFSSTMRRNPHTYKRANIAQRFEVEDSFYRLTMELLSKIIGPFEVMR